jgi:excisionase family DNA binding protein
MASSLERQGRTGSGRTNTPPHLIDMHEVAEVLCVTPRHIQRLVAERRIPYLKIGRFVRFDRAELSVWLDQQRVDSTRSACCGRIVRR